MAATADQTFWGFVMYVTNNPYKSMDDMTLDDFWEMVKQFAAVNVTASTITVATARDLADYYGYGAVDFGTLDFPKQGTTSRWATDGNGVACSTTYALNMAAVKQASYPEEQAKGA
jgi:hypothetical protein